MDHKSIDLVGPGVSQAPTSSASSVALPISARHGYRHPRMPDTTSASTNDALGSQQAKKNTREPCRQLKTTKVTQVTNRRLIIEYDDWHRAAPTMEQHSALAHDIGYVVRTYYPMRKKSWKVMPDKMNYNFDDINNDMLAYVNKLFIERSFLRKVARMSLRTRKKIGCGSLKSFSGALLCQEGESQQDQLGEEDSSPPFEFEALLIEDEGLVAGGSKFLEIDVFEDFYVRPRDKLAKSLNTTMMEKRQLVLQEAASQLPPKTPLESVDPPKDVGFQIVIKTLDHTL